MPDPGPSPNLDPRVASAVLRAAVDAIIVADRLGRIRQFNPAAEALFGWSEAEVVGKGLEVLMPDDVATAHAGYLRHHLETGRTAIIGQGREVVAVRRDGTSVDVNLSVARFEMDGDTRFVGILRNITAEVERRRRLQHLAEELAQQSAIADARIELEVLTRSTRGVDDLARELLGTIARRVGANAGVLYLAHDATGRTAFQDIARFAVPSGQELSTDLVAAAGSARELRVIEGTPESLLVDTSAGSVVPASVAAVPLVHYDEVIGAVELALPVGNPNLRGRLDAILPTVAGVLAARLDQQRIHRLLEHSRNQALELQQLNQKLDERAMLLMEQQHALEESHAELQLQTETLSMQREELIETNTELQRARELAEEHARELDTANRYKSQFLANMSHELRTPLNSILILARLLVEDDGERLDEDQLESARSIGSAGRDLLELINDILDISRIEVGELRIAPVRFDFEKSIRTLDRLFRPVAEERGLDFVLDLELDVPDRVVVDELRLHQILRNLLSNAFKFTDRGNVTLRVASGLAPDRITFAVADTGVGIPPEAQAQIFNAFSQADGSLTRKHTGAGLGLAISRQLAERMGGSLSLADSSPGGSTFVLDIPVGLPDATPAAAPQRARDPGRSRVADEGEIVIVEADPVLGRTLTTLAHIQGYRAKWFADGKDAYLHCLRAPPSCVLVDLRLPETPGEPLLEALSEDARTRDIPVHALSGVATTRPGTASLLAKPIRSDRFVEWLGKSLRHLGGEALLVEANDSEALAMTKLLAHHGVTCRRAADLDAVREGCAGTPVQCILLGLDLDLHDAEAGARLLADLGRDPELGTLPVIAYTSRELDDDEQAELQRHPRSIIVEQTKADPVVDETRRPAGNLSRGLSQRRVLVVDDDVRNVFALRQLLRHREIEVVVAEDGAEALRRVDEDGPFDAILMDVMMPVMDGLEATRRLRARPDGESFFIVALTAKAMPGDRERCLRAGASDYLAKPIDNDVLLWRLAAHFRTSPPHTPLSPAGGAA